MYATKTVNDVGLRQETYSEPLGADANGLRVSAELANITVRTHVQPQVDVEARLREVNLSVWQENGCIYVVAENERNNPARADNRRKAEIVITMPANFPASVHVVTGSARIQDLQAAVCTHIITGQITLMNLGGPVVATTVTGSVHYAGGLAAGSHRFAATTGTVRLALDETPDARVYGWATTGSVQCSWPLTERRRGGYFTGDHVYGVAGSGEGRIVAEVVTGSVHLGVAGASS